MKKIYSLILILTLLLSMAIPIHSAASGSEPSEKDPKVKEKIEFVLSPTKYTIDKNNSSIKDTRFSLGELEGKFNLVVENNTKKNKPSIVIELNGVQIPDIDTKLKNEDAITIPLSNIKKENLLTVKLSGKKGSCITISLSKTSKIPDPATSMISVSESNYDFGDVAVGTVSYIHTFTVTNTSKDKKLMIAKTKPSLPDFKFLEGSILPQELRPGAKMTFSVEYKPLNLGKVFCEITLIDINYAQFTTISLSGTGTGNISSEMSISEQDYSFGYVYNITSPVHTFTLKNSSKDKNVKVNLSLSNITNFELCSDNVSGKILAPGESKTFDIKVKPSSIECSCTIIAYDTLSAELVTANVSAIGFSAGGRGPLAVSDYDYFFGNVDVGKESDVHKVIVFDVSAQESLKINMMSDNSSDFEIVEDNVSNQEISPRSVKTFGVKFKPAKAGKSSFTILITDENSGKEVDIKISGMGTVDGVVTVPDPDAPKVNLSKISITEFFYDFGDVTIGKESSEHTFTIINDNKDKDIKIMMTRTNLLNFEMVDDSAVNKTIPPGRGKTFSLKFKPTAAGKSECIVYLMDDVSKQVYNIRLIGTGVEKK